MKNLKGRYFVYLALIAAMVSGIVTALPAARPTQAKENDGDYVLLSCTLAGSQDQNLKWVLNPAEKNGQPNTPRVTMLRIQWEALKYMRTSGQEKDRNDAQTIADQYCNEAAAALVTPTVTVEPGVTATLTTASTGTVVPTNTAIVLPTVTPDRPNPNKNKTCVWEGDATKGHWNCGTGPAIPHPSATPTLVIVVSTNTPMPSDATPVPTDVVTQVPTTEPTPVMELVFVGYFHDVTGKECKKDTPSCSPKYEWRVVTP